MVSERKLVTAVSVGFARPAAVALEPGDWRLDGPSTALSANFESIITSHGGTILLRSGNGLLAAFGTRQAQEDDAINAVRAALELQSSTSQYQPAASPSKPPIRIGIHTGVFAVVSGSPADRAGSGGEGVHVAQQLQERAPQGAVIMSQDTYRHLYGSFDVEGLPPVALEGVSEPLQAYLVLRARPRSLARTLRGVEGVEADLIGRSMELERLKATFRDVMEKQQLRMVTVVGEAGIGKSRLLYEFLRWLQVVPYKARVFCGRADSEWAGLHFSLVRDVFCSRFEIQESDQPGIAREKFSRGFAELMGEGGSGAVPSDDPEVQAHFIGLLLGFDFDAGPAIRKVLEDSHRTRQQAFQCISGFFASASKAAAPKAAGAALLVLEDVHWSDDDSLDLIAHLADACRACP